MFASNFIYQHQRLPDKENCMFGSVKNEYKYRINGD
jgi:hypothetical protein